MDLLVCRAQQELAEKQRYQEEEVRKQRHQFADDVRVQIREKEQVRIHERQNHFQEGIKLNEEAQRRQQRLDEVKQRKLQELR
jgi:Trichohyalin-plectin-homology domain